MIARPARPRPWPAHPPDLPARRLRRRLRRHARRARHRSGDRRRLLDGRPGRAAALAPPPRPRRRARALRDHGRLHADAGRRLAYQAWMLGCGQRGAASVGDAAAARPCPRSSMAGPVDAGVGRGRDAPPRLAHDRRGRPLDQHVPRGPLDRRGRRADRVVCHRSRPRRAAPTYSSPSPTPSPARPSTASPTVTSPAPTAASPSRFVGACLDVADRVHWCRHFAGHDLRPTTAAVLRAPTPRAPSRAPSTQRVGSRDANTMCPVITTNSTSERPVVHERRAGAPAVAQGTARTSA